jgi:hypothetical protein
MLKLLAEKVAKRELVANPKKLQKFISIPRNTPYLHKDVYIKATARDIVDFKEYTGRLVRSVDAKFGEDSV